MLPLAHPAQAPIIHTVAGAPSLALPSGVAAGPGGVIYVADGGSERIFRIDAAGRITTYAGTGAAGFAGDGGPATAAELNAPNGLAVGPDGSLYVADTSNERIRRIAPDGTISTVAGDGIADYGGDGGPATAAELQNPLDVAVDPAGTLYVADTDNDRIRRIGTDGLITTFAGRENSGYGGDGGPAASAYLDSPDGVAVDPQGRIVISDLDNLRLRRVDPSGIISTIAGTGGEDSLNGPGGLAVAPDGSIYVAERYGHRVVRIGAGGSLATVAGTGEGGFTGELTPAAEAELQTPADIALDAQGRLLIADRENHSVRRVGPLALELGTVTRAYASVRSNGRRLCATFTFGQLPAPGLPVTVGFRGPDGRHATLRAPRAPSITQCASGPRLRTGRWSIALHVAGHVLRTLAATVRAR